MANRAISFIATELRDMLPPPLVFLVAFNLQVPAVALLFNDHELSAVSHFTASVGALPVGKAFLIALVRHAAERLLTAATGSRAFLYVAKADAAGFDLPVFAVIHLWLLLLLFVFAVFGKAVEHFGANAVSRAFFAERRAA